MSVMFQGLICAHLVLDRFEKSSLQLRVNLLFYWWQTLLFTLLVVFCFVRFFLLILSHFDYSLCCKRDYE